MAAAANKPLLFARKKAAWETKYNGRQFHKLPTIIEKTFIGAMIIPQTN